VVTLYLATTLAVLYIQLQQSSEESLHRVLGVPISGTNPTLAKRAFRRRNKILHPDKCLGSEEMMDAYNAARLAYDTLSNNHTRWAYERLGPIIFTDEVYKNCQKKQCFLKNALNRNTTWMTTIHMFMTVSKLMGLRRDWTSVENLDFSL
jgi:DnaJ-class molecular chaperone